MLSTKSKYYNVSFQSVAIFSICIWFIFGCARHQELPEGFFVDFEKTSIGKYTPSDIKAEWPEAQMLWGKIDMVLSSINYYSTPIEIVNIDFNKVLKVNYPANKFGPIPGTQWTSRFKCANEVMLSYRLFIPKGFEFVKGGKLPGLAGGSANAGGNAPNGYDGWSARLMFHEEGEIVHYLYYPNQPSKYGDYRFWTNEGQRVKLPVNEWVTLTQRIKMNEPKQSDGEVEAWLNGTKVFTISNIRFRDTISLGIDQVLFSTFYGGSTLDWAPNSNNYLLFDDFKVWRPTY